MPRDDRDYKVELSSAPPADPSTPRQPRPYLSVLFSCCSVYQRIYRSPNATTYAGRCHKCGATVSFPVGPGGTSSRFFIAK